MGNPVSFANCSLMCLVGFGVDENADLRISNCFAFMVVLGPRLFEPAPPSPLPPPAPPSGLLFSVWLSLVSGSPSREPWANANKTTSLIIDPARHGVNTLVPCGRNKCPTPAFALSLFSLISPILRTFSIFAGYVDY